MSRTINNKPVQQILEELSAPLPDNSICYREFDQRAYIPVEIYLERLNSVLGIDHYSENYRELTIVHANDSFCVSVIGSITLLDDDYQPIFTKEMAGGSNINFSNKSNKSENTESSNDSVESKTKKATTTASIPNDTTSACQDAFKKICNKKFGIGAKQLDALEKDNVYEITFLKVLNKWKEQAYFSDILCDNKNYKFAIFKSAFKELEKLGDIKLLSSSLIGKTIKIYGKVQKDNHNNDQIVFTSLYDTSFIEKTNKKEPSISYNDIKEETMFITTQSQIISQTFKSSNAYTCKALDEKNVKYQLIFTNEAVLKLQEAKLWDVLCESSKNGIRFKAIVKQMDNNLYIQDTILE